MQVLILEDDNALRELLVDAVEQRRRNPELDRYFQRMRS